MRSNRATKVSYKEASYSESEQEHEPRKNDLISIPHSTLFTRLTLTDRVTAKKKVKRKNNTRVDKDEEQDGIEEEDEDEWSDSEVKKKRNTKGRRKGIKARVTKKNCLSLLPNELFLEASLTSLSFARLSKLTPFLLAQQILSFLSLPKIF